MYEDIIHLPHHVSSTRPQMPMSDRAAQFSPFAALTGYDETIRETQRLIDQKIELNEDQRILLDRKLTYLREQIKQQPDITVTYFLPDARKSGGMYVTVSGKLKRFDEYSRSLLLLDGTEIPVDNVVDIDSVLFNEMM